MIKYYICQECDKTFSSWKKPKVKAKVIKSIMGVKYAKNKKINVCCNRPLREITKPDFQRIRKVGHDVRNRIKPGPPDWEAKAKSKAEFRAKNKKLAEKENRTEGKS
jgi:hypothetical protein